MGVSENQGYLIWVLTIRILLFNFTILGFPVLGNSHIDTYALFGLVLRVQYGFVTWFPTE